MPTQVAILSRSSTVAAAVAAMKEGAGDYLPEPSSADDLRAAVGRMMNGMPATLPPGALAARRNATKASRECWDAARPWATCLP